MLRALPGMLAVGLMVALVAWSEPLQSQEAEPIPAPAAIPKGIEVQARGPVHEAFATPVSEPKATPTVTKQPPKALDELPPEERPEGDVHWIGGYWSWDDDRQDFLWVSGCWRVKPVGQEWVPGYWRDARPGEWQWVPGFWTAARDERNERAGEMTYYPQPPAPPPVAPGAPPGEDMFYVPGYWMWYGERYVWRAGYWARVRPGQVYVPTHYRWTPHGYILVAGYWDYPIARRGLLYAPVVVQPEVISTTFVYTPSYAVQDTIMLDALFVRPACGAYYFGDYYGASYTRLGFESCFVYSQRHYEPIIVYEHWNCRSNPAWFQFNLTLYNDRYAGRAPLPPRTLVQQNVTVNNVTVNNVTVNNVAVNQFQGAGGAKGAAAAGPRNVQPQVLAPAKTVLAARGEKAAPLDPAARTQVLTAAKTQQQALAQQRQQIEAKSQGAGSQPRVTNLTLPQAKAAPPGPAQSPAAAPNRPAPAPGLPKAATAMKGPQPVAAPTPPAAAPVPPPATQAKGPTPAAKPPLSAQPQAKGSAPPVATPMPTKGNLKAPPATLASGQKGAPGNAAPSPAPPPTKLAPAAQPRPVPPRPAPSARPSDEKKKAR